MKLKEFWNNLFIGEEVESNGMSGGYRKPPLIRKYARWPKAFWLKYWQPIGALFVVIGVIIAVLTFYFQYLKE
jgi:hypothetical protein